MHIYNYWENKLQLCSDFADKIFSLQQNFDNDFSNILIKINSLKKTAQIIIDDLGTSLDDEQYCSTVEMNLSDAFHHYFFEIENEMEKLIDKYGFIHS